MGRGGDGRGMKGRDQWMSGYMSLWVPLVSLSFPGLTEDSEAEVFISPSPSFSFLFASLVASSSSHSLICLFLLGE